MAELSSDTSSDVEEANTANVYQFKITLKHIRPPIWRRIQISSNSTFAELHNAVVGSMGWLDSHLHSFKAKGLEIGPVDSDLDEDSDFVFFAGRGRPKKLDETVVKISEYFKKPKDSMKHLYDFGDGWLHNIVLEKILPYEDKSYPICIAGKRACPPDDCGGVDGYESLLVILSDPKNAEHQDMKEWMSGMGKDNFDPEAFDPNSVNLYAIM